MNETVLLVGAVALFIGGFLYAGYKSGDLIWAIFGGWGTMFVGGAILFFIGGFIGTQLPVVEVVETKSLCAIDGSYLISDVVSDEKYDWYCYSIDGETTRKISHNKANVTESDEAVIVTHTAKFEKDWWNLFANTAFRCDDYTEFFVPEVTIATIVETAVN